MSRFSRCLKQLSILLLGSLMLTKYIFIYELLRSSCNRLVQSDTRRCLNCIGDVSSLKEGRPWKWCDFLRNRQFLYHRCKISLAISFMKKLIVSFLFLSFGYSFTTDFINLRAIRIPFRGVVATSYIFTRHMT
jgi:hypothetical protein